MPEPDIIHFGADVVVAGMQIILAADGTMTVEGSGNAALWCQKHNKGIRIMMVSGGESFPEFPDNKVEQQLDFPSTKRGREFI